MSENNVRYYRVDNNGKKKKGSKKPIIVFIVILIAVILMGWLLSLMTKNSDTAPKEEHITILHIEGTIQPDSYGSYEYSQSWTMGTGGSVGELYLSKSEKQLLGGGNSIGAYSPLEG